jgi:hypothetical protein
MVRLQTLDLRIGVRVPASQPTDPTRSKPTMGVAPEQQLTKNTLPSRANDIENCGSRKLGVAEFPFWCGSLR